MKKNYLLIAFLLLGAATLGWYFFGKKADEKSTIGWDRKFKVENPDDVHKIFIAYRTGENVTLEREGDHWLFDGKYRAGENVMKNLLEVITKVELKFQPAQAAIPEIVRQLGASGIKVEVYNKKGEKIKAYYVGGVTIDADGTYMILENSDQPHAMRIPTMEGQLRTRFELHGDNWRDKTVFRYKPEDIAEVSIEYPLQKNKSFKLKLNGGNPEISPYYEVTPRIARPIDKSSVEAFLLDFKKVVAESFINDSPEKDSIQQKIPFSIVTVTDTRGQVKKAAFYPTSTINNSTGETNADFGQRYNTLVTPNDLLLCQHLVFSKIFWAYEAFFKPPTGGSIKN